jgi:antitoxin CptB
MKVWFVERNRLFWGSRRGMLELDLVLMPFLDNVYPSLSQADKERYWKLLECEDQDMFSWFLRREDPDDNDLKRIVEIVRNNTGLQPEPKPDARG